MKSICHCHRCWIRCATAVIGAVTITSSASAGTIEFQTLFPDMPETSANFGAAVAISGNTAIVGAPQQGPGNPNGPGAAYIYRDDGFGNWSQIADFTAVDSNVVGFGRSVAIQGNTAIVGAANRSAFVFRQEIGGSWEQISKLEASSDISFGRAVSIGNGVAIVGGNNAGYIFRELAGGNWIRVADLSGGSGSFGATVGISGDLAVVGAPDYNAIGIGSGAAFVYQHNGSNIWNPVAQLFSGDLSSSDHFGSSVAIEGTRLVVGAQFADGEFEGTGAAYVFEREGGVWTEVDKLVGDEGESRHGFRFGISVALSGDSIAVGALRNTRSTSEDGGVYAFIDDGSGNWTQFAEFVPSALQGINTFGRTVGTNGDVVIAGVLGANESAGLAHLFNVPDEPIPRIPEPCTLLMAMFAVLGAFGTRHRA